MFEQKDFTPIWSERSIKNKGNCLIWFTYDMEKGTAKVHKDHSIDFELFLEAFQSQFITSYAPRQGSKNKSKAKGKGKTEGKATSNPEDFGKFRFNFQFKPVMDWANEYDNYKAETRAEAVD